MLARRVLKFSAVERASETLAAVRQVLARDKMQPGQVLQTQQIPDVLKTV